MTKFKVQTFILLFFALDKLLMIPDVRYFLTDASRLNPYAETLEDTENSYFGEAEKSGKKIFWNFGTSRSFPFYYLPVDRMTAHDKFISPEGKRKLLQWYAVNFSAPAALPSVHYTRIMQMIGRGKRPEFISIEISFFPFNKNSNLNRFMRLESIPLPFVLAHLTDFPFAYAGDILASRAFFLSRYKISASAIAKNLSGKKKESFDLTQFMEAKNKGGKLNREYNDSDFSDTNADDLDESDAEKIFFPFPGTRAALESEFFSGWEKDDMQIHFLKKILEISRTENIPIVFWMPKLQKGFLDLENKYDIPGTLGLEVQELCKSWNVPLIRFSAPGEIECNYFKDASHLSPRCYNELILKIIGSVRNN
ncbi:MAG: DUF1574 domain-containing protein [Leptospira sp.]|nr:DUF1574 domain-containing protein [Leptospira sp.]